MTPETASTDEDLVRHLAASTALPAGVARRLIEDVLAHYAESVESYVRRRHRELTAAGYRNPAIYERLAREVERRLFKGPACTARQIRRIIYG